MKWVAAHGLLSLAEGVFQERGGRLRAEEANQPLHRAGADRLPGEVNPDQGRGSGRANGGARRVKKDIGEL